MSTANTVRDPFRTANSYAINEAESGLDGADGAAYILLILQKMDGRQLGLRRLELMTRINRARLGRILHRDPEKRSAMTILEFGTILKALDIDPIEAVVTLELGRELEPIQDARFARVAVMLATLIRGLPQRLVEALHDHDDMDGSEIREEWGIIFQKAVVNRMAHEVRQILDRRAKLSSLSDPFSL